MLFDNLRNKHLLSKDSFIKVLIKNDFFKSSFENFTNNRNSLIDIKQSEVEKTTRSFYKDTLRSKLHIEKFKGSEKSFYNKHINTNTMKDIIDQGDVDIHVRMK